MALMSAKACCQEILASFPHSIMRDKEKLRNELGSTCHPARLVKMSSRYLSLNSPVVYFVRVLCFVLFIDYAFFNGTGLREAVERYVSSPKKNGVKGETTRSWDREEIC